MYYIVVWTWIMITHATSHEILVGRLVLYLLEITLDFWEQIVYHWLGWKIKANCKASLLVKFIGGQIGKSN